MTEILLIWLNTEVDLSKKIKNLEDDFANGYYLGELLYKFNQLTNFHEFRNRDDRDSKLNNFNILQKVLANIRVKFDSNKAKEVMEKKRGVISLLLYQIRTKLEKKGISMENLSLKKSSHINELYQSKILGQKIEKYDRLNEKFFNERLARLIPAQKDIEMKKVLQRFEDRRERYDEYVANTRLSEMAYKKAERDRKIDVEKSKAQRVHAFNQMFEQKGIENWKKNMIRKKKMEEKDLEFQLQEAEKFQNVVFNAIKKSENEVIKQIDKFENLLNNIENEEANEHLKFNKNQTTSLKVKESAAEKVNKITEKVMKNPLSKKERDRRRRKIIVEQSKAQLEIENMRREQQLISKLFKQSNQEKQLAFETYRVSQSKEIIIKNRYLREEMYSIKNEMDIRFNEENQKEFLNLNRDKLEIILNKEEIRRKTLSVSLKQNLRSKNTDYCKNLVDMIIEITQEAYNYQQVNDVEEFDGRVWREWTQLFINNISVKPNDSDKLSSPAKTKEIFFQSGEINHVVDGNSVSDNKTHDLNVSNINNNTNNNINQKELPSNMMDMQDKVNKIDRVDEFNNSVIPSANQTNFATGFTNLPFTPIDKKLDECELYDYVNYLSQWSYDNVHESNFIVISLADLMQPEIYDDPKAKDNKAKNQKNVTNKANKKDDEEFKEDNPMNLEIPKDPVRNELFGNLIDILIDIKFGEEQQLLNNEMESEKNKFQYIPIKLILNGQPFSGKKSQVKRLSEKYNLKVFIIEDLIKLALDETEKPDEFEEIDIRNDNLEDLRENEKEYDDDQEVTKVKKENLLKDIGLHIKEYLKSGSAIPDFLYVKLYEEIIKLNFPYKSKDDLINEAILRNNRKNEILEKKELVKDEKEKRPKYYEATIREAEEELKKLNNETIYGFCIMNFPTTYNQAKLLERALSGYVPDNEKTKTQTEIYKEESGLILDKSPKPEPPKRLIQSGIDYFFYINTDPMECARRAYGRKFDPVGKVVYHLQDNPPPIDNYICERLQNVNENENSEASFVTRCVSFENTIVLLKEFYEPFGFERQRLSTWIEINGNPPSHVVNDEIESNMKVLINLKQKCEEDMLEENENPNIDLIDEEEVEVSGEEKNNLNDITANEILEVKNNIEEGELAKYLKKIEFVKKQLSPELVDLLLKIWFRMFENYIRECKSIFKFIRRQRDFISNNYNNLSQKFIDFLKRPSKKQLHLLDYQIQYNKFLDDYPDLKDDPRVKEEHHQRVDDLSDKIFEIIEIRKAEAVEQRNKVMSSNWIENEMEKFYHNLERLYQIEIDKFLCSLQIIKDYYHGIDNRVLAEIPFYTIDIIKDEIDPVPIEKDLANTNQQVQANTTSKKDNKADPNTNNNLNIFGLEEEFPRVEKLYRTSLRVQYQYDEMLFKAEKERIKQLQEKDSKDKKAKPKVDAKSKANNIEVNIEEKKEEYLYDEEMKEALLKEKAKYRCRITMLKNWGIKYLKNLRKQANEIYSKLEDWIILAIKAENEALNQLCTVLKKHIEDEQKIKYELELDTFDIKINMDVVNYIEEPPKLLPAKEVIDQNKFNIQQLNILIGELSTYIVANNNIRTSNFLKIFEKKYITSKTHNDVYYGLPNCLKKLTFHNFYKFVKCFDPDNTDFMNLQHVLTFFCILLSPVCTEENETDIKNFVGSNLKDFVKLDKEAFIKTPMWFDNYEGCIVPQGYEVFDRVERIKEIIFEINKDEDDMIDIFELCNLFTLKKLNLFDSKNEGRSYYDVLFF